MLEGYIMQSVNDKSLAMVQISCDSEVIGKITKTTLGVSRMFGYNEDELIGRKVTILVPPPYNKHHDDFILRYQSVSKSNIIGREKAVFGQHKSGYVFPITLAARVLP